MRHKSLVPMILPILIEWIALFPVFMWVNGLILSEEFEGFKWFYLILFYLCGQIIGRLTKNKVIELVGLLVVSIGLIVVLFEFQSIWQVVFLLCFVNLLLFRGTLYSNVEQNSALSLQVLWVFSLPTYFISYFFFRFTTNFNYDEQLLSWMGMAFVITLLFLSNSDHLKHAALSKHKEKQVEPTINRQNRIYIICLFLVVLLLTHFNIFWSIIQTLLRTLFTIFSWLSPEPSLTERQVTEPRGENMLDYIEPSEPSLFFEIIEMVLKFFTLVIFIGLILFALIKFVPKVYLVSKQLLHHLIKILSKVFQKHEQETPLIYEDEKESLLDWKDLQQRVVQKTNQFISRFKRQPNWDKLSDKEKVRFLYKQFVLQSRHSGYEYSPSETAHEFIKRVGSSGPLSKEEKDQLDLLYNEARYRDHPLERTERIDLLNKLRE